MRRGKEVRESRGNPIKRDAPKEVPVRMFVMVEKATGAFTFRCVTNDAVMDLRKVGALDTFLSVPMSSSGSFASVLETVTVQIDSFSGRVGNPRLDSRLRRISVA
jgi:hypothetical protein